MRDQRFPRKFFFFFGILVLAVLVLSFAHARLMVALQPAHYSHTQVPVPSALRYSERLRQAPDVLRLRAHELVVAEVGLEVMVLHGWYRRKSPPLDAAGWGFGCLCL